MKKFIIMLISVMLLSVAACDDTAGNEPSPDNTGISDPGDVIGEDEPDIRSRYVHDFEIDEAGIVSKHGKLSVVGTDITDKDGNPYQLRGMSSHGIAWYPQFLNIDALRELRDDWGTNVFRIAMYTGTDEGYGASNRAQRHEQVRNAIRILIELDMYIIIDWHLHNDRTPLKNKDLAIEFFDEFSMMYADYDNILYEICNEPNGKDENGEPVTWVKDIKPYAEEIIPVIRANDPDGIIIVGTAQWSQLIEEPLKTPLEADATNVMYTLHFYANTHKDWLRDSLKRAHNGGLPVFVTEFGICSADGRGENNFVEAEIWLSLLDELNISYVNWAFANKAETVCVIKPSSGFQGGWTDDDYTEGGAWIRNWLRYKAGF